MKLGSCQTKKGEMVRGGLRVATDQKGGPIFVPIWIASGLKSGKTIFLSAGVHGDEINGIETLRRFIQTLDLRLLSGTILILPIVNLSGFQSKSRLVQYDGKDLNRCFPGDKNGTVSEQMAYTIFREIVSRSEFGVDIHDSGQGSVLLPHPRIHREGLLECAAAFGSDIIMTPNGEPYPGLLSVESDRQLGIPSFTVEIGGGTILWNNLIDQAVVGLRNLLIYHGMLPGQMVLPKEQFIIPGKDDLCIKAPMEGILSRHTELGQGVNTGEMLAEIFNPITAESATIHAKACGVVHDLNVNGKVNQGEDVVGVLEFGL